MGRHGPLALDSQRVAALLRLQQRTSVAASASAIPPSAAAATSSSSTSARNRPAQSRVRAYMEPTFVDPSSLEDPASLSADDAARLESGHRSFRIWFDLVDPRTLAPSESVEVQVRATDPIASLHRTICGIRLVQGRAFLLRFGDRVLEADSTNTLESVNIGVDCILCVAILRSVRISLPWGFSSGKEEAVLKRVSGYETMAAVKASLSHQLNVPLHSIRLFVAHASLVFDNDQLLALTDAWSIENKEYYFHLRPRQPPDRLLFVRPFVQGSVAADIRLRVHRTDCIVEVKQMLVAHLAPLFPGISVEPRNQLLIDIECVKEFQDARTLDNYSMGTEATVWVVRTEAPVRVAQQPARTRAGSASGSATSSRVSARSQRAAANRLEPPAPAQDRRPVPGPPGVVDLSSFRLCSWLIALQRIQQLTGRNGVAHPEFGTIRLNQSLVFVSSALCLVAGLYNLCFVVFRVARLSELDGLGQILALFELVLQGKTVVEIIIWLYELCIRRPKIQSTLGYQAMSKLRDEYLPSLLLSAEAQPLFRGTDAQLVETCTLQDVLLQSQRCLRGQSINALHFLQYISPARLSDELGRFQRGRMGSNLPDWLSTVLLLLVYLFSCCAGLGGLFLKFQQLAFVSAAVPSWSWTQVATLLGVLNNVVSLSKQEDGRRDLVLSTFSRPIAQLHTQHPAVAATEHGPIAGGSYNVEKMLLLLCYEQHGLWGYLWWLTASAEDIRVLLAGSAMLAPPPHHRVVYMHVRPGIIHDDSEAAQGNESKSEMALMQQRTAAAARVTHSQAVSSSSGSGSASSSASSSARASTHKKALSAVVPPGRSKPGQKVQ